MANGDVTATDFAKARDFLIVAQKGTIRILLFLTGQGLSRLRMWKVGYHVWAN